MRTLGNVFLLAMILALTGCGCLETYEERLPRPGSGGIDPDQSALNRCLFGTRHLPYKPPNQHIINLQRDQ